MKTRQRSAVSAFSLVSLELREGFNSGGWKDWKVELLLLSIQSGTDICCTAMIWTLQCISLIGKKIRSHLTTYPREQLKQALTAFPTASLAILGKDFLEAWAAALAEKKSLKNETMRYFISVNCATKQHLF